MKLRKDVYYYCIANRLGKQGLGKVKGYCLRHDCKCLKTKPRKNLIQIETH